MSKTARMTAAKAAPAAVVATDTTPAPAEPAPAVEVAPAAAPLFLWVKVLKGGIKIAGGTAAAGRTLKVSQEVATYHEGQGNVKVLGTV
ncbi:hypothetical protein OVA24_06230 [Luteolibacter sp. SL250]|uniref:hypothetical protein n=1 Tax=Luteolibacter sp. SL250 TaxID=2995170 RepID=UPI002270A521|nr:hypothetical protein [Luteolibacter sp. SL250]WAC20978.1 hypothetical protein OVA24_06230 [Luteolibacter sp. SL250]